MTTERYYWGLRKSFEPTGGINEITPPTYVPPTWDDIRIPFTRDKQGQSQKPDYDFTNMGLLFPQNNATEIVYITIQFPHKMQMGSDIYPHIHYVQDEVTEPIFKMDYRWYKNGSDPSGAFTTLSTSYFAFTYTSGSLLQIACFPIIDGSSIDTVSSIMDVKVYRDDNIVAGDVLTKEFDIHYQIDTSGSRTEFAK